MKPRCRHYKLISGTHSGANYSHPHDNPICEIKNSSEAARDELNSKLLSLKIGGCRVNRNCDINPLSSIEQCPAFEPNGEDKK